ncbi:hypothetical protein VPH35_061797 [Triticum aestivum]
MATAQSAPTPISLFLRLVDRSVTGTLKVKFDFSFDNQHEKQDSSYILAVKPNVFSSPSTSWGIHEHISDLLLSKEGTDVTFKVGGEEFAAHRCVLAARSAVFKAELFGPTKDGKMESVIQIKDMESKVFRALPSFIYTDLLPEMEMNTMQEGKAQETLWLQHLLAAADRYDLQRLKALYGEVCEERLCEHINVSSVTTILIQAEQLNCCGLKGVCFEFLKTTTNLKEITAADGLDDITITCPSLLKELIAKLVS